MKEITIGTDQNHRPIRSEYFTQTSTGKTGWNIQTHFKRRKIKFYKPS